MTTNPPMVPLHAFAPLPDEEHYFPVKMEEEQELPLIAWAQVEKELRDGAKDEGQPQLGSNGCREAKRQNKFLFGK